MRRVNLEAMIRQEYLEEVIRKVGYHLNSQWIREQYGLFDVKLVDVNGDPVANDPTIDDSFDSFYRDFH